MRSTARSFLRDEGAAVAPLFALTLTALIAVGGIAFDYARLAGMDTELQNAADQAALAAATQLDGRPGACDRAINAARNLLKRTGQTGAESGNFTFFSNIGGDPSVTIGTQEAAGDNCTVAADDPVRFYTSADGNTFATSYEDAKFVEVRVDARTARYALTPVVSALNSDAIDASARAGLGSAVCKVPPLMICNPEPDEEFNADAKRGWGIMVTGHGNTRGGTNSTYTAWAPGDFGFLEAGAGNNQDLLKAMAFQNPSLTCLQIETGEVNTGNPQGLYDAINTRFDIYDFASGQGTTLAPCFSGSCPSALNTTKDLIKFDTNTNGNRCKLNENAGGNQGWRLPDRPFSPRAKSNTDTPSTRIDADGVIHAMGLPRDNCHYTSYGSACGNDDLNRFGNGNWARADYFFTYHNGRTVSYAGEDASNITRYNTYLWEIENNLIPHNIAAAANFEQYGRPICSTGTIATGQDRRVMSVAVVDNCAELRGGSRTADIGEWVDMFLVEPTVDKRGNGAVHDSIYMEIIGKSRAAGNGSVDAQTVYRSSPYLVR